MTNDALSQAVAALRQGDAARARQLLKDRLAENPRDEQAWLWACEAAATPDERIACLKQVLTIDPAHAGARQYLARLENLLAAPAPAASVPSLVAQPAAGGRSPAPQEAAVPASHHLQDILLAPLGCLLQTPLRLVALVAGLLVVAIAVDYFLVNGDFFGLTDPHLEQLSISASFEDIRSDSDRWQIAFEKPVPSRFAGVVRYVGPIREAHLRLLTHDILVTSGDYAAPSKVATAVFLHHFFWQPAGGVTPAGTINLLHTVPASEAIYRQLLAITSWDHVVIDGREILTIDIFDAQGNRLGQWTDSGCNSLLVQSVSVTP